MIRDLPARQSCRKVKRTKSVRPIRAAAFGRAHIKRPGAVHTDEWRGYNGIGAMGYRLSTVNHSAAQCVCPTRCDRQGLSR